MNSEIENTVAAAAIWKLKNAARSREYYNAHPEYREHRKRVYHERQAKLKAQREELGLTMN
jgi:cytochrome c-type biogenesis protein CcmH/NrfG